MSASNNNLTLVFGATGAQGGAVVRSLLKAGLPVRAVSRNPTSDAGKSLAAQGVEVVEGDLAKPLQESIFAGVSAVFLVTTFGYGFNDFDEGKPVADLAAKAGVKHFIFSSLPNVQEESGGKFYVAHFTNKAKLENYIKGLNAFQYTTFPFAPFYFQNFKTYFSIKPDEKGNFTLNFPQTSQFTYGDVEDVGALTLAALQNPEKYGKGNQVPYGFRTTPAEAAVALSKKVGKPVAVNFIPRDVYATLFPGAAELAEMIAWFDEFGQFGKRDASAQDLFTPKTIDQWLAENEL